MFSVGFQFCEAAECCYAVPKELPTLLAALANIEEVLLRRMHKRTVIVCENEAVRRVLMRVVREVQVGEGMERGLVLEKVFGVAVGQKEGIGRNVEVVVAKEVELEGIRYLMSFQGEFLEVTSNVFKKQYPYPKHNQLSITIPKSDFEVSRLGAGNSWMVKTGQTITFINPTIATSTLPHKILITSPRYHYLIGLLTLLLTSKHPLHLLTTQPILDILITRCCTLFPQLSLTNLLIFHELTQNQFLTLPPSTTKLRVIYLLSLLPTLMVCFYYKGKSLQIVGDWYYDKKELYFAWKRKELEEKRYYELVSPAMKETVSLVGTGWVEAEAMGKWTEQGNVVGFQEGEPKGERYVIVEKVTEKKIGLSDKIKVVNQNCLFGSLLSLQQIYQLVDQAQQQTFKAGQLIVKKGMKTQKLYFICSGSIQIDQQLPQPHPKTLTTSDMLCQYILLSDTKLNLYSAKCLTDVILLSIRKDSFLFTVRRAVLDTVRETIRSRGIQGIQDVEILDLHGDLKRRLVAEGRVRRLEEGNVLDGYFQGSGGVAMYVVLGGRVRVNQVMEVTKGRGIVMKSSVLSKKVIFIIQAKQTTTLLQITDKWLQTLLKVNSCKLLQQLLSTLLLL